MAPWPTSPSRLPAHYLLESVVVDGDEIWLRYTNGLHRFSIFEQRGAGGDVALQPVKDGWFWKRAGIRYLITGAPAGSVPEMAASLR
jgi:hypothetical protein